MIMLVYSESLIFLHAIRRKERQSWGCKGAFFFGKISLVNNPKKLLNNIKPTILLSVPLTIQW